MARASAALLLAAFAAACSSALSSPATDTDAAFDKLTGNMVSGFVGQLVEMFGQGEMRMVDFELVPEEDENVRGLQPGNVYVHQEVISEMVTVWSNFASYMLRVPQEGGSQEYKTLMMEMAYSSRGTQLEQSMLLRELYGRYNTRSLESGGGWGYGLQVYCNNVLMLTTGGGMGLGLTVGENAQATGGMGGGGGLQATGAAMYGGNEYQTITNVGGGGGATTMPGFEFAGSEDAGQITERQPFEVVMGLRETIQLCRERGATPYVVGGGGGGGGIVHYTSGNAVTAFYGRGFGFRFGATLDGRSTPTPPSSASGSVSPVAGHEIGDAANACQRECLGTSARGSGVYYCLCTCNKSAFQRLGLSWANSIQCSHNG